MVDRRTLLKAGALLPLAGWLRDSLANDAFLLSAPIAGHFTHDTAHLWLQASRSGRGMIRFSPAGTDPEKSQSLPFELEARAGNSTILVLRDLKPSTRYAYRLTLDGNETVTSLAFRTAPAPDAAPQDFRLYAGSCAYTETRSPSGNPYGDEFHIFDTMASQMNADPLPHFMLWLGDNLYLRPKGREKAVADFASAEAMDARYREVRSKPFLQNLFKATHHYAIWDDHDYGPNNADKTFALKNDSLRLFRQYWPNPDMGSAELPGTWCRFSHQDAEFFLLDDRFYRDHEEAPPDDAKAMFGPAQIAWLKHSLKTSTASFRIIANGSQLLSKNRNGVHSGWHNFKTERDDFLAWLQQAKIPGLILLSGDRHNTQVFKLAIDDAAPVFEFCTSPLTSHVSKLSKTEWANPRLVRELAVEKRNFGTLEFSGKGIRRKVTARCFDADGNLLWTQVLAQTAT